MSDTTKITKARVNGVLYDLGGSGGTGGVSGAWLAPGELIESGYIDTDSESGWSYMTIDPEALVAQLEKAGVDVDESPFMNDDENQIYIGICQYCQVSTNTVRTLILINMSSVNMGISLLGSIESTSASPKNYSLKELIYSYFSDITDLKISVPSANSFTALTNYVQIQYVNAHTTLKYYIPDMSEFCDEVFVEYNSSSES